MSKINKSDTENFRAAMSNVLPIKQDQRHRDKSKAFVQPNSRQRPSAEHAAASQTPDDAALSRTVVDASIQALPLLRNGLPRKLLRQMGSKHCPVADSFDLHGMNEKTAAKALDRFLADAIHRRLECVRVVHGKGLRSDGPPVLKLMSWKLLWQQPAVLALKPCAAGDGGSGAVLVLLRRQPEASS